MSRMHQIISNIKLRMRKWRSGTTLSLSQDFYVFAIVSVLAALIFSGVFTVAIYQTQQESVRNRVAVEAKLIDSVLSDFLLHVKRISEDKGRKIALKGAENLDNIYYLLRRQFSVENFNDKKAIRSFKWPHFAWVTPDGYVKVKSDEGVLDEPEKIKVNGDYLTLASSAPWKLHLSKPVYSHEVDNIVIYAAIGVFDEKGRYLGAITTQFEPDKLIRAINERVGSPNTQYVIVDQELDVIMSSLSSNVSGDSFAKQQNITLSDDKKIISPKKQRPYHDVIFSAYIESVYYPFYVFAGYNPSVNFHEFLVASLMKMLSLGGLTIVLVFILFVFYRVTIKPIKLLSDSADKILAGEAVKHMPRGKSYETHKFAVILLKIQRYIRERNRTVQKLNRITTELENTKESLLVSNKALEEEKAKSIESKKNRERLIARVKQEIKAPLQAIEGFIKVLITKEREEIYVEKKTMLKYLNNSLDAIENIKDYTTNHLVISKVTIPSLVEECINIQSDDIGINNIELNSHIPHSIPDIFADELRLNQIITALIYRAIEDHPDKIDIHIQLKKERNKRHLSIEVIDDGIGYTEEERKQLFEKYNNGPISRKTNGTDLALPAIRKLVELHAGELNVENVQAKGTKIEVIIPYRSESDANKIPGKDYSNTNNIVYPDFKKK